MVRGLDGLAEGSHDFVPAPGDLGGALEVFARLLVAGEELERREVSVERLLRIADLALVEGGDLAEQLELGDGILLVTELDLDGVGEGLGVVGGRVDRDERFGRLKVVGLELEDLLVGLRRAIQLLLLVAPELGDLEEERDLRAAYSSPSPPAARGRE